jgi:membrane protein
VLVFLFLIAPFIIIVLVLRYLIRRHNDKVMLTEKAIESGRPIPSVVKSQTQYRYSNEQQWQRGVKTAATGLGLMLLFAFLGAEQLIGVGALVLCMGAGQMIIGKTSRKKDTETHDDFSDEKPEFTEEKDAEEASNNDETHPQDK